MSAEEKIKEYLESMAEEDASFALAYAKPHKSFEKCMDYIKGRARKMVENGVAIVDDDEVFGWAVHYYQEDSIGQVPKVNARVATTPTAKPKAKATRKKATAAPKPSLDNEIALEIPLFQI